MTDDQISATREIDAPAAVLFDIVADPRMHPRIDGGGTLRGSVTGPDRLTAKGDRFAVRMRERTVRVPYRVANTVVEFEQDRRIAWRHFGGHRWRWEFDPLRESRTLVTHTYAYGFSPVPWLLELTGFVDAAREGMPSSLRNLERLAAERTAEQNSDATG